MKLSLNIMLKQLPQIAGQKNKKLFEKALATWKILG